METNSNSVGLTFDILTIAGLYALLLLINYVILRVVITFYPVDLTSYQVVSQIINYAHIIMPIVTFFLATIHGMLFLLEAYLPPRMPVAEVSEEEERAPTD